MSNTIQVGRFVVVEWRSSDQKTEDSLENFIKAQMPTEEIKVLKNPEKALAQVEFTSEQDPEYLKVLWNRREFWEITNIYAKEESRRIKVENIPTTAQSREIYRYFTTKRNVLVKLSDVEVEEDYFRPKDGFCVVRLKSAQDVKQVCAKSKDFVPYREHIKFDISIFYEEIIPHNDGTSNVFVEPIVVSDIDGSKLMFLKDFCSDMIDTKLQDKCGKIEWSNIGIKKVKLIFDCSHGNDKRSHSEVWRRDAKVVFSDILAKVRTIRKTIPAAVWSQVIGVVEQNDGDIWVDKDERRHFLTLIGLDDDANLKTIEETIERLVKPKPVVEKKIRVDVKNKLDAFDRLELKDEITEVDIFIEANAGIIKIKGEDTQVKEAETRVLELLNKIIFNESELPFDGFASILNSQLVQDTINADKEKNGWRCGFIVEKKTLKVFATDNIVLDKFRKMIMNQLSEQNVKYDGKVDKQSVLVENLQKIEDEYSPYVKLTADIRKDYVTVQILSTASHVDCIVDELKANIDAYLIKKEPMPMGPNIFEFFHEKLLPDLKSKLVQKKINVNDVILLNKDKGILTVVGNEQMRREVISLVTKLARAIRSNWTFIEREGIHNYMLDGKGNKGNEAMSRINSSKKCQIRWVSQNEMMEDDVYCIVPLKTGQIIFVCNDSITTPKYPVDVVVLAADNKLAHTHRLSAIMASIGGQLMQKECKDHLQRQGHDLNDGDVFSSSPGKLRCQRIIHAVEPKSNDPKLLAKLMINIMAEVDKETNLVLRTLAMPIIKAKFEKARAAKILLQAIKDKVETYPNLREIYFYDTNQKAAKTIQKQMQIVFGDKCFHMPRNAFMKGATMRVFSKSQFWKQRNGQRVIPLPRNKTFVIQWGDISQAKAMVVVSPTPTAPTPTGKILHVLQTAAGQQLNLVKQCKDNFTSNYNNNISDGGIAESNAGRLPCDKIYHLKINHNSAKVTEKDLGYYIEKCLEKAVRNDVKEIAFPTIGTADCNYPPDKVARAFFRTVANFVKLRPTCSLEKITVIAYSSDLNITGAFDLVLAEMYNHRFHRLKAEIEDDTAEKDPEPKKVTVRPPSPIRRQPTVLIGPGNQSSQSDISFNIGSSSKHTVHLEVGLIQDSKADAIVCSTSSFPKLNGKVSDAIKRKGGSVIQDECNTKYSSYPSSGVAVTKGGQLQCKEVLFVVLQDYKPNGNEKSIYQAVRNCLEQAENDQCSSIAIPILGTGGFKYPANVSASKTFAAINDFFKSPRYNLKDVTIVMFGGDKTAIQAFKAEASSNSTFSPVAVPSSNKSGPQSPAQSSPASNASSGDLKWNVSNSQISLNITYGNLECAKEDVILNTTTSFPNLNGIIPKELCKIAGPGLQTACNNYKGQNTYGMIVETDGFGLSCKKVYHYLMPVWQESTGQQSIERCIEDCLYKMKDSHLSSIAVPSIGTGGAKYTPTKVARGIYRAVQSFGSRNPSVKCLVNLVLFPGSVSVNKVFEQELQQVIGSNGSVPKQAGAPVKKKGVHFGDEYKGKDDEEEIDENVKIPTGRKNFVLFQIITDDPQHFDSVRREITTKIDNEIKRSVLKLGQENLIKDMELLKGKHWDKVVEFGEGYNVKVELNTKDSQIVINGFGESVMDCYQRILNYIKELRDVERNKAVGKIAYQHIEWYYKEDDGKIWVPYPKNLMYILEDSYCKQEKRKEFRDIDDKLYVADFNTMIEYEKDDKQKKTAVGMIRKDFTEGALKALPDYWEPMDKDENLKEVKLQHSDAEYQTVELAFNLTGKAGIKIVEIWRIQNRVLYQQYQATKEQMEDNRKSAVSNVERHLWHGTSDGVDKSIIYNGFNRSYSGQTFAGQVWYGHGVYFAVNAKYSLRDDYTPIDSNGRKRLFYARVLTGLTTRVDRGYTDRFAPLIQGSQTDRFDSTCDDDANPEEFVIFKDTQTYPEYIVYCK